MAVSSLSAGLAALAGLPLATGIQLSAAVLAGQLSIGWSNDYPTPSGTATPPGRQTRHLANVLPDLQDDTATGVRGLPHRLGAKATALAGAELLLVVSTVILFGPGGQPGPWRWAGFATASLVAGAAAAGAYRDPSSRLFFLATILIAVLDLAFFALSGTAL